MELKPHVRKLPGIKSEEIIKRASKIITKSTQDTETYPFVIRRAKGLMVEDVDGNRYIDFSSGFAVLNLGHSHPRVVEAIREQLDRFTHFPLHDFYLEHAVELAEKLAATAPGGFEKHVIFQNSGAEANEVMMKLAKYTTRRLGFIAFYNSFHGRTYAALGLTASKTVQQEGSFPPMPGIAHVPYPNPYRNPWGIDGYEEPDELVNRTLEFMEEYVFRHYPPHEIAAIVFEPIQGEGGYIVPPKSFFKKLARLADEHGILLADDEVQMGVGRTGAFWAIEHFGISPDFIQFGKAIGGGIPLSGVIHRSDKTFDKPGVHSSTFGGNALAIAAGNAVVDEVKKLLPHARRAGEYLGKRLGELKEEFEDMIGDSRGIGLARAIEIVKDTRTKEPWPKKRDEIIRNALREGLILIGCGDSSIRVIPPINVKNEEIDLAMELLEKAVKKSVH